MLGLVEAPQTYGISEAWTTVCQPENEWTKENLLFSHGAWARSDGMMALNLSVRA